MNLRTTAEPCLRLSVAGETPAKKNSKVFNTKTHRAFPSTRYREWHEQAVIQIRRQMLSAEPVDAPVFIVLTFSHTDKRRRDFDNGTSSILDLLVDCGVLPDDNTSVIPAAVITSRSVPKESGARCDIAIYSFSEIEITDTEVV